MNIEGCGGNEQEIGRGVEGGVHYHRVFSMLFGLWFWSWGKVRGLVVVRVIFRVRVMCIVGVRVRL